MTNTNTNNQLIKKQIVIFIACGCFILGVATGVLFMKFAGSEEPVVRKYTESNLQPLKPVEHVDNQVNAFRFSQMIAELKQHLANNPKDIEAWAQLGNTYFDSEQFQNAIDAYRKYLEINPGNPDILTDMGVMYRNLSQPEEAIKAFDRASEVAPRHEMSRLNKGIVLLYDLNKKDEAIACWKELLKINPAAQTSNGKSLQAVIDELQTKKK